MKKNLVVLLITFIALISCNNSNPKEDEILAQKSYQTDSYLIDAIQGNDQDFVPLDNLLELLLDNVALSDTVIKTLIMEPRLPNDFVELCIILSCPINTEIYEHMETYRDSMQTTNIQNASEFLFSTSYKSFTVINHPNRMVIFGDSIIRENVYCDEDSCSSNIRSYYENEMYGVPWGTGPTTGYISGCNPAKWVCGDPLWIDCDPAGGGIAVCAVTCSNSDRKCIRIPKRAR